MVERIVITSLRTLSPALFRFGTSKLWTLQRSSRKCPKPGKINRSIDTNPINSFLVVYQVVTHRWYYQTDKYSVNFVYKVIDHDLVFHGYLKWFLTVNWHHICHYGGKYYTIWDGNAYIFVVSSCKAITSSQKMLFLLSNFWNPSIKEISVHRNSQFYLSWPLVIIFNQSSQIVLQ